MKKNYSLIGKLLIVPIILLMFSMNIQAQLYINEFLASNDASFPGPQGDYPDWIEIYNAGPEAVNLSGYYMSDVLDDPTTMYQIPDTYPDSVTVEAGGFIVFYANKGEASSVMNLNFKLSGGGESIGLWNPESVIVDELTYGEQVTDASYGRMPDGSASWQSFISHPEMGFTASPHKSNITLKINELLAKNDSGIVDEFGNLGDWIELYNFGETEVDITGLFMSDIPDDPELYSFNPTVIPSGAYLLVWCDGADEDIITVPDTLHADFKLGAGGETIKLSLNANTIIDSITFGAQTADISYGRFPDGTDNWVYFTVPTPRESNSLILGPVISDVLREPIFPEFTEEVIITSNVTTTSAGLMVTLKYNSGQGYIDVQMLDDGLSNDGTAGDNVYGGAIPAMEKGTFVSWYVEASDDVPSTSFYPTEGAASPLNYRVTDWTPVEVYDSPFAEPSGLAYNSQTATLFSNNDGSASNVYEISTSSELLNTLTLNGNDFEGIAFSLGYDTIFVVEEANWKVIMYNLLGEYLGEIQVASTPGQINGLEGITVDPETGHIFVLAEKSNPTLIELTVNGIELNRTELDFSTDVSGITIHPVWNTLFIVSDEASTLNEVTKNGDFLRSWYIPLDQAEGVTFGENENVIYMVADRGGKLYKFDFNFDPYVQSASLYINEFMASNDGSFPGPEGDNPDWIEIYNAGNEAVMLGGYYMSDILDDPAAMYQIPSTYPDSVTVPAGGYILFYANKGEASSVLNLNFKLSAGGENIGLWNSDQEVVDQFTYTEQTTDVSYGRYPDGSDDWGFMVDFTPGTSNTNPAPAEVDLYINEFMASNDASFPGPEGDYPDWIEIYNAGPEAVNLAGYYMYDTLDATVAYQIPSTYPDSVTVAAGGYIVFYANKGEASSVMNLNFKLSGGGEQIGLWSPDQELIEGFTYNEQITDTSYGRYMDGTDNWYFMSDITPGSPNTNPNVGPADVELYINEFMASNDFALAGPQGDFPDWIEIYNAGTEDVMLGGYYIADDLVDPEAMFQISDAYPDSVTVEAGGYIVFYANGDPDWSVLNLDLKLSGGGEQVGLWNATQTMLDSITYGPQLADTSYGRFADGTNNWYMMPDFSPGESNRYTSSIEENISNVTLKQNYPNPFSGVTNIEFSLNEPEMVTITVYSSNGSVLSVLTDKKFSTGNHIISWDASQYTAGYYFYSVKTENGIVVKKAVIIN